MNMVNVKSSNIVAIGYESGTLRIVFSYGAIYDYKNVSQEVYDAFLEADSKGSFFHRKIRDNYIGIRTKINQTEDNE